MDLGNLWSVVKIIQLFFHRGIFLFRGRLIFLKSRAAVWYVVEMHEKFVFLFFHLGQLSLHLREPVCLGLQDG